MTITRRPDSAIVIGAGVVGLCTAYWLQKAGLRVTVLDARGPGAGASHGNAGWIVPSLCAPLAAPGMAAAVRTLGRSDAPFSVSAKAGLPLVRWLWRFSRACGAQRHRAGFRAAAALAASTFSRFDELVDDGVSFEMHRQGLLFCFLECDAARAELEHLRANRPFGYALPDDVMDGGALRTFEPTLSEDVAAGFHVAEERHVQPATLVAGLVRVLAARGAQLVDGARVSGLQTAGRRVTQVLTDRGAFGADAVVVAAGAWSVRLVRQLGLRLPMQPAKGYSVTAPLSTPPRRPLYLGEAKVGVSPFARSVRLAGTFELSGLNEDLDRRRVWAVTQATQRYLAVPFDASRVSDVWSGLRPVPSDGLPVIGAAPGYDDVYLATGHGMVGVTLAPATGATLAEGIVSRAMPPVLGPFDPGRFRAGRTAA